MEEKNIKVSMLQMSSVIGDIDANMLKIKNLMNKYYTSSNVLVLPEVWSVGWACKYFRNSAQDISDSSIIRFLSNLAKEYNVNIIGGSFITYAEGKYYNTCPVVDKSGNLVACYNKNHLYSYYGCDEDKYVSVGETPVMVELDGVKFGLTICYDIRFPEIYRSYAKNGVDILVNCAAWGAKKSLQWEIMTKSRAIENQCYMVALTQSGPIENDEYNLGESRIIDYNGYEVAFINEGEKIVTAELNLDDMYAFRQKSPTIKDIKENYEVKTLCIR